MNEVELVGGQLVPQQSFEAITQIASNRTLLVQQLTTTPTKPAPVKGLKTVEEVFAHFKPMVQVGFEKSDGTTVNEDLVFSNISDFGQEGITSQSNFLRGVKIEQNTYQAIAKQLRTNKILKAALANSQKRAAFLQAIEAMMLEMENTKSI